MSLLLRLREWWHARRASPLDEQLVVEFDDEEVRVRVVSDLDPHFNQTCRWDEITRVCFKDGGMYASDIIFLDIREREKPIVVLTEARGGAELCSELSSRGLFPERVWRRAIGDTSGRMHCWPPKEDAR